MIYPKLINLELNGYSANSTTSLRLAIFMGFFVSICAFAYMRFIFIRTLINGDEVRVFPTLIIILLFLGGIQLISHRIMGEYIGNITKESVN